MFQEESLSQKITSKEEYGDMFLEEALSQKTYS